jgi:hypothetical protein
MPGKGRPFVKGVSGNPGGRPKVLGDVQELARQKSPEAITTLGNIMHDEKAPELLEWLLPIDAMLPRQSSRSRVTRSRSRNRTATG